MTQALADYWSRLETSIHPDDIDVLSGAVGHGFNLDYPPPAFVGDVVNAPVIILDNNGGYDALATPREFAQPDSEERWRVGLANSLPASLGLTSPYYLQRNYSSWLRTGNAALVNGVAYRSIDGNQPKVAQLTAALPSASFHRKWLTDILLPLVDQGQRCLIVHRWKRWPGAAERLRGRQGVIFSAAPISKDLTADELDFGQRFLAAR